jgi:sulfur carrier protein
LGAGMIRILLNNQLLEIENNCSLEKLLKEKNYSHSFAIAVNYNFIPRSDYATLFLNEGDRVEVVAPMQGG